VEIGQHRERADALFESNRWEMALSEYFKYLATEPNSDYAQSMIALCLSNLGKETEALEHIDEAISLEPEDEHHYYIRSFILQKLGRDADAYKAIQEAIELAPDVGLYHAEAASCLLGLKKNQEAEKESEIAIELSPNSEQTWYQRAVVMMAQNKLKSAHEAVDQALAIEPESMRAHTLKGVILGLENKFTEAIRYYREALRINPTSEWARSGYMEALRGRSPVYKILVFFSTARMPRFFFFNVYVLLVLIVVFLLLAVTAVLVKAISPHLLNVFLALDPDGASALERSERQRAKILGVYVVCSWMAGIWLLCHIIHPWALATFLLVYAAPILITRIFEFPEDSKYRRYAAIYAGVGLLVGISGAVTAGFAPSLPWDNKAQEWGIGDTSVLLSFVFLVTCLFSREFWKEHKSFF
jgi:tetratricopeptide (TPR) repeat protein